MGFLLLAILFLCDFAYTSSYFSISASSTDDDYRRCSVEWGSNTQSFKVFIDTTSDISWVFNKSAGTDDYFHISESSTYKQGSQYYTYEYQNYTTTILTATDTLTIDSKSCENTTFALAINDSDLFDDEDVDGILALNRNSTVYSQLSYYGYVNTSVTIDVSSDDKIYFGSYTPSDVKNSSNVSCSNTASLGEDWSFEIDAFRINGVRIDYTTYAVIDAASPYITIYANTFANFLTLWQSLDGSTNSVNCNYTTRECSTTSDMFDYLTLSSGSWNITLSTDDLLDSSDDIRFILGGCNGTYTADGEATYVLFLGAPVLEQLLVTLEKDESDSDYDTLIFYYTSSSSSTDWETIVIVLACVVTFTIIFFAIYFWRYGKIPPHTNHDIEEQSLLRGPLQQSSINNNANPAAFSQPQPQNQDNQLQQAQRQQPPQRSQPTPQSRERQAIGSGSGQAAPQNPDDLRLRRLRFLEEQEKRAKEEENKNDDNL